MIIGFDGLIIVLILFILIYVASDSFFALLLLFWITIVEDLMLLKSISSELDIYNIILMACMTFYALCSMIMWITEYSKEKKIT
jgi:hypothetical protein